MVDRLRKLLKALKGENEGNGSNLHFFEDEGWVEGWMEEKLGRRFFVCADD